ncbi:conserved hypothetical protein [Ricinus communis]|uniref:Uncharacterized protein n=1 Tax=Ricinus communis TaxID=3988 RepID=B9S2D1_RICCO|nr:conserved hypothetical protein [Ricinus communis]
MITTSSLLPWLFYGRCGRLQMLQSKKVKLGQSSRLLRGQLAVYKSEQALAMNPVELNDRPRRGSPQRTKPGSFQFCFVARSHAGNICDCDVSKVPNVTDAALLEALSLLS